MRNGPKFMTAKQTVLKAGEELMKTNVKKKEKEVSRTKRSGKKASGRSSAKEKSPPANPNKSLFSH